MLPITLTEAAKDRIMELVAKKTGCVGMILRIATGKGCGGNEYKWDYAEWMCAMASQCLFQYQTVL